MSREYSQDRELPWWLASGPETCQFCLRTYHQEAGYYCAECDRPVCPVCVMEVWETRIILCPGCRTGGR